MSVSQCGAARPQLDEAASHCSGVGMKLAFGTTGLVGDPSRSDGQQVLHAPRIITRTANTARPQKYKYSYSISFCNLYGFLRFKAGETVRTA